MKKTSKKENFSKALARLKEGLEDFEKNPCDIIRDGVIQRFEFTAELAWKACKEYLEQAGHKVEGSPKPILRKAYEIGLISQEETWIDLISARNHTSHLYEEKVAVEILGEIQVRFLGVLEMLGERLAQG